VRSVYRGVTVAHVVLSSRIGRRIIFCGHIDVESIEFEHVDVRSNGLLHRRGAVQRQWLEQRLRIDHRAALKQFETILLICRMLIDDEAEHESTQQTTTDQSVRAGKVCAPTSSL
jgi:hypothetical protein